MSDLEEPPAKVLKIDNIDGVTHVTELSEMPTSEFIEEHLVVGEESGIIEGGADEGQEEWLSEGVLTDDDYNPASQESQDADQTDSQLGSSQEEEHLDTTLDSDANDVVDDLNMTEGNSNIPDNDANITETDANVAESDETYIAESDGNIGESDANITESDTHVAESEGNLEMDLNSHDNNYIESQTYTQNETYMDTDDNLLQNMNDITGNVTNITESMTNLTESMTNATVRVTNVMESVQNVTDSVASMKSDVKEHKLPQMKNLEMNIEETMEQMEGAESTDNVKVDVFDSLLIKKTDSKSEPKSIKPDTKDEEDDGNDTDDLLRMLGGDESKTKKKLTKTVKDIRNAAKKLNASSDDDDDFVYEGTTVKKIKVAKAALAKKQPAKAEPEDDAEVMENEARMFGYKKKPNILAKKGKQAQDVVNVVNVVNVVTRQAAKVAEKPVNTPVRSQPLRQYHNKRTPKPTVQTPAAKTPVAKTPAAKTPVAKTPAAKTPVAKAPASKTPAAKTPVAKTPVQITRNETNSMKLAEPKKSASSSLLKPADAGRDAERARGLRDAHYNMEEDEFGDSDLEQARTRQRIMRPEMMDEEMPSDGESNSEDGSLYDELPSSDSDDVDDWFQIDIRAETAGDYLPLLGSKAKELLQEEEQRVSARLLTLKQSLSALTESGKRQADQLREATMALAEIDDMLKAS